MNKLFNLKQDELNRNKKRFYFLLISFFITGLVLLSPSKSIAQSIVHRMYLFDPGLIINISTGPSVSFTDIKKNIVFPSYRPANEWRMAYQFTIGWDITQYLRLGGQLAYGNIAGSRPSRDAHFEAKLLELNFSMNVNPILMFIPYRTDQKWAPYFIVGIGLSYYNSTLKQISDNTLLAQRGFGNGGGLWGLVIEGVAIGGIGVSYKLNEHWSLRFETANRWMNSDKLDSVESLDRSPYDFYNFTTFGISYKIFKNKSYPVILKKKNLAFD